MSSYSFQIRGSVQLRFEDEDFRREIRRYRRSEDGLPRKEEYFEPDEFEASKRRLEQYAVTVLSSEELNISEQVENLINPVTDVDNVSVKLTFYRGSVAFIGIVTVLSVLGHALTLKEITNSLSESLEKIIDGVVRQNLERHWNIPVRHPTIVNTSTQVRLLRNTLGNSHQALTFTNESRTSNSVEIRKLFIAICTLNALVALGLLLYLYELWERAGKPSLR